MTHEHQKALVSSLRRMLDKIGKRQPIADELGEIERLRGEIRPTAPAQLSHFLERRSYAKALSFLETGAVVDDPARPACDDEAHHP